VEKFQQILAVIMLTVGFSIPSWAADIKAGQKKAETVCVTCHGAKGCSKNNPLWPKLAGQHQEYLMKQLKDFKSGKRKNPLMSPQAKALGEGEMQNVAAYFAKQSCQ